MKNTLSITISSAILALSNQAIAAPSVDLEGAILQGLTHSPVGYSSQVDAFMGVKYASAERFQAPKINHFKAGVHYDMTAAGDICPQIAHTMEANGVVQETQSEDCLNANVWRPSGVDEGEKLPVYVFIHGGAFELGSSTVKQFDGANLVAKNADEGNPFILVSMNYRLGILGSYYSEEHSGNYGIQDQKAALQWIHEHIDSFGGDADNITLFGESAGAMSIGIQLMDEQQNSHLYQRAIMESNPYGVKYKDAKSAKWIAEQVKDKLSTDQDIRTVPFEELINIQSQMKAPMTQINSLMTITPSTSGLLAWAPYVDGETVPYQPSELKSVNGVDVTLGFNKDESNIFVAPFDMVLNASGSYNLLVDAFFGSDKGEQLRNMPEFHLTWWNSSPEKRKNTARKLMNQVLFMCSSQHVAQNLSSNQTTTSLYQFNYQPDFALWPDYYVESFTKTCSPSETSCHGAELSFIFGNEVNAVSGPTVFSEKDHQAKDVLMSNWLKSKTFEPYSQETDNITVFNEEAYFNVSGDWDNTKNGNVCSQVNEIMNSNTKLY
ncbi:carboxylesterase family protein [Vibrio campbellii]|uniref:Carboxylic ester hydrolase n=1 Tax=Vibrio campbellii TaxID=680 RepID=A0ABY5IAT8_9VIBR|nr:carboxylesterase family protein [Vibrio campbellii]UTZ22222.1 carboxylesterase family protein [Vibrio campbellii]UTZ30360.1 carboxylesterase family protein [Vibrio campbellii]